MSISDLEFCPGLLEGTIGDLDLTAEQLETIAAQVKDRRRLYINDYLVTYRQDAMADEKNAALVSNASMEPAIERLTIRVNKMAEGIDRKYRCDVCGYSTDVKGSLVRHLAGEMHLKRVAAAAAGPSPST
ncbi:Protein kinase C-like 1 [Fusarium torreyae]|uniref:Protein kinase C-like 1 n=1 Tax=Fusarium torreyae TaxID=1237075 RepID=A0A9W8VQ41_9HYPO|nr:Protein kinase C-like 1 [Fusarium torreyae]